MMRYFTFINILCAILLSLSIPRQAFGDKSKDTVESIGDYTQLGLPIAGLILSLRGDQKVTSPDDRFGAAFVNEDGRWFTRAALRDTLVQAGGFGAGIAASEGLKELSDKSRPNLAGTNSFPSGHTVAAFNGAAMLTRKFGKKAAAPAYLVAAFTGFSRIYADKHHLDDVISGASLGMMSNWLANTTFQRNRNKRASLSFSPQYLAMNISIGHLATLPDIGLSESPPPEKRFRFGWEFGPSWLHQADVRSPDNNPGAVDFRDINNNGDPRFTGRTSFDIYRENGHQIRLLLAPYEFSDQGMLASPVSLSAATFPAGDLLKSNFALYDARASYGATVFDSARADLLVAGGLSLQYAHTKLTGPSANAHVSRFSVLPLISTVLDIQLDRKERFYWQTTADGMALPNDYAFDLSTGLQYRTRHEWDISAGYRWRGRNIDTSGIVLDARIGEAFVGFGFTFFRKAD